MAPPFSSEEFFQVFAAYNTAVWPAQVLLNALAVTAIVIALRNPPWAGKAIAGFLASLWLWMGVVYHWIFFSAINPAARLFAVAFVAEGALLAWLGLRTRGLRFEPRTDAFGVAGAALMAYALAVYPMLGVAFGHTYPAQPTFGLPCPTTIFTVGMLLWARPKVPWLALLVPALWSVVGMSAVRSFSVVEDAVLPVAGILGGALVLLKNRRASRA
jgi:Family of unknown function (DUF6064)